MAVEKIRQVSVSEQVAEELARRIIGGNWSPGEALPSARQLAVDFGVSALTVREAIQSLKGRGLVESRHGSGTYVTGPLHGDPVVPWMLTPREAAEFRELSEARHLIEGIVIGLAADRRTPDDLQRLEKALMEMHDARTDAGRFLEADLDFHIALADAAHNRILLRTMLAIRGPVKRLMAARAVRDLERDGTLDQAIDDHDAIYRSVRAQEPLEGSAALDRIKARGGEYLEALDAQD